MTADAVREAVGVETIGIGLGGVELARTWFESICSLYAEVFSVPPFAWDEQEPVRHRQMLERLLTEPSFGITVAVRDDELVGFAYGYGVHPDTKRWENFLEPLPEALTTEWEGRTFALIDLAVRADLRGHGLGRRLLEVLLASRSEERAALTVEPEAEATQAFYQHLSWQRMGRKRTSPGSAISYFDAYVLPLRAQTRP